MKENLLGKNPDELKEAALSCSLKGFVGSQIAQWLYTKRVTGWDRMSNIGAAAKEALQEKFEIGTAAPVDVACSADGTKKYLFDVSEEGEQSNCIEAVVIPDEDRRTLCVSCQAGCKMGCKFCMTGRQGFHGSLSTARILNQFLSIDEPESLTNAVFMGMGEPMDNYDAVMKAIEVLTSPWGFGWSPKRITVSTVGVVPQLKRFLDESRCHLAVSLHNPFPEERYGMMPVEKAWSIRDVVELLKQYDFSGQRRVSFEYTMFEGWNDDERHAEALYRLLGGLECRVNLIRFHRIPEFHYGPSGTEAMEKFQQILNKHSILCTIRASRGEDIFAACGLLAGKHSR